MSQILYEYWMNIQMMEYLDMILITFKTLENGQTNNGRKFGIHKCLFFKKKTNPICTKSWFSATTGVKSSKHHKTN